jgi:hypothetical protein
LSAGKLSRVSRMYGPDGYRIIDEGSNAAQEHDDKELSSKLLVLFSVSQNAVEP